MRHGPQGLPSVVHHLFRAPLSGVPLDRNGTWYCQGFDRPSPLVGWRCVHGAQTKLPPKRVSHLRNHSRGSSIKHVLRNVCAFVSWQSFSSCSRPHSQILVGIIVFQAPGVNHQQTETLPGLPQVACSLCALPFDLLDDTAVSPADLCSRRVSCRPLMLASLSSSSFVRTNQELLRNFVNRTPSHVTFSRVCTVSHVTLAQGVVRVIPSMFHAPVCLFPLRPSTLHSSQSLSSSFSFS